MKNTTLSVYGGDFLRKAHISCPYKLMKLSPAATDHSGLRGIQFISSL
jgi:hypothetical protein